MDSMLQSTSISTATYCGIQATLGFLVATFVTIRLRSNYVLTGKLAADDYLSPIAILFWAGYSTTSSIMSRFMNSPAPVLVALRVATANAHLAGAVRYFSKAPLLILYIRIFGIKKWVRVTCYITLVFTAVIYLICSLYLAAVCSPSRAVYDEALQLYCFKATYALMITRGLTSVLTDVVMLCLPLMVISKLQLSLSKKIGIALVFMSGIFGIAAASVSLYFSWNFLSTPSDKTNAALLICVESAVAIMVGCTPALHAFWTHYIVGSALFSRLRSTPVMTTRSRSERPKNNNPSARLHGTGVTTHRYVELNDVHPFKPVFEARASVEKIV